MDGIKTSFHHHKHYFPEQTNEDYYEGPRFDFPKLPTTPSSTFHHIKDTIVTTAKTLVTDIYEPSVKDSTEQNVTSILTDNGTNLNSTILDEGLAKINNTVTDIMESTNSSIITDVFQRNNTLGIMGNDNATFVNATDDKDSGLLTTTENIVNYITNATKNLVSSTTKKYDWSYNNEDKNHNLTMSHQGSDNYDDNYQTTYIIMGVIIAILLIVIGVITYFYITHKKKHVVAMHGQYTTSSQRAHGSTVKILESPENDGQNNFKC